MSAEGFFHDAHEVYCVTPTERAWIATFRDKDFAEGYAGMLRSFAAPEVTFEVVPV